MAKLVDEASDALEVLHRALAHVSSVKPKALYALLCVFSDIVADLLKELILRDIETTDTDLKHLDVFAGRKYSSNVAKEAVEHLFFRKMAVAVALELDISDLPIPCLVRYIIFELLKSVFIAEEVGVPHMQFCYLSRIEHHSHLSALTSNYNNCKNQDQG